MAGEWTHRARVGLVTLAVVTVVLLSSMPSATRGSVSIGAPSHWANGPTAHARPAIHTSSTGTANGRAPPTAIPALPARSGGSPPLLGNVRPALSHVNPFVAHAAEPAPMGVADFGVTGSGTGSNAYQYATPSFEANAYVHTMHLTATSGSSTFHIVAFELNAVMMLRLNGTNYSYWIQNGLHVDTSSNAYAIGGAYVWNFSSPTARLSAGELRGNSSSVLATDTYYFIPGCGGFPGQCSGLVFPVNLTARIALSTCGGYPCVDYEYNIGAGWVTYDIVSFLHMAGATPVGFLVDGYHYTPLGTGTFYDAEWDWVAAGGGSAGRDDGSNLAMGLAFWNGHEYQSVPSAWNFGGDTGENSFNVTATLSSAAADGTPLAQLSSGPGSLGVLYNGTAVGFLNVSTPAPGPANLSINGRLIAFQGGSANFTLVAGAYSVSLQTYSNATAQVTVRPGQTTVLNLSGAGRTTFEESGLPSGTHWGVSVGGLGLSGTGRFLAFNLPDGSYAVAYAPVPGFIRNGTEPAVLQVPTASPVLVGWSPFTFAVPVQESGLPAGTAWWVNASGVLTRGSSTRLNVSAPNGSTDFTVGAPYTFIPSPDHGTIYVTSGRFSTVEVQFSVRSAYIVGTLAPTGAQLTIGGVVQAVSGGTFNDTVVPGTYTLVASATGYLSQTRHVTTTPGNVTTEQITLDRQPSNATPSSSSPSAGLDPWVEVGVGVAVLVVAGALIVVLVRRRSRSR